MKLCSFWRYANLLCIVVFGVSCSSQTPSGSTIPTPDTNWKTERAKIKLPAPMLASLDAVEAQNSNRLGVLRTREKAAHRLETCFPFEKSHESGRAVDIAVGDWNDDGKVDLLDACLVASTLESRGYRGGLGVYGHQTAQDGTFWVHCDEINSNERWGGLRDENNQSAQAVIWSAQEMALPSLCQKSGLKARQLRLEVQKQPSLWRFDKQAQTLNLHPAVLVYAGKRLLKAYPAALGFDPIGDKQKRNDYRTPEGEFYLCEHKANSQFYRALRLSYPSAEDAARGLRAGLIDQSTHNRIAHAIRKKRVPPQSTKLGGDIMIHGGGIGHNWTWGCVALENNSIKELFDFLPSGTRVTVRAPKR